MRAPPPHRRDLTAVTHEDDATEVETFFSQWRAARSDDAELAFDRELDDDPRRRRGDGSSFRDTPRFATGTGQFDLRGEPHEPDEDRLVDAAATPLSLVMARKVVCVRADLDACEARSRMLARGVSGLPVVDDWGRAVGVVSKGDLLEHEVTSARCGRRVADVMMPLCFSLPEDATIGQAAALMAYEGIHRVVVVDRGGYVIGLVSALDVARWLGSRAGHPVGQEL
jgi:CBS domain-containing protein